MKKHTLAVLVAFMMFHGDALYAQCFASPGNPIAGSTNLGILDKGITRTIGFMRYGLMDRYYEGSRLSDYSPAGAVSSASYSYAGLSIGYGITPKLTVEAEAGYFFNRTQKFRHIDYELRGSGFSNAVIAAKYNVFQDLPRNMELTLSAGPKIPFSTKPQVVEGVELPIGVQASTGNYGLVVQSFFVKEFDVISARLIMINRYENNFTENQQGYKFGDAYISSLFLSKHLSNPWTGITKHLTFILQGRHEYRRQTRMHGHVIGSSGHNLFFVVPQLNFNPGMIWNFSMMVEIPVYQHYQGTQLANSYAVTFSVARDIGFGL